MPDDLVAKIDAIVSRHREQGAMRSRADFVRAILITQLGDALVVQS